MHTRKEKPKQKKSRAIANSVGQKKSTVKPGFVDNRSETAVQRKLQTLINTHSSSQPIRENENNTGRPGNPTSGMENLSDHSTDIMKSLREPVSSQPVMQMMKVKYRGYWFDLGDSGEEELRFMSNTDDYVKDWYMEKLDAIYYEFTEKYDFYDEEIGEFCDDALQLLDDIPNLQVVLLFLSAKKQEFEEDAQYRYPIKDAGLGLSKPQLEQAVQVFRKTTGQLNVAPSTVKVTGSSGAVVTFILTNGPCVVQYYLSPSSFNSVKGQIEEGMPTINDRAGGISHILDFWDTLQAMVLEKVRPIAHPPESLEEKKKIQEYLNQEAYYIYNDIVKAILDLHEKGLSQGDVSLDNIGQRIMKHGRYVLFDFNRLRKSGKHTLLEDIKTLNKSFIHWKVKIPEMHSSLRERLESALN